MLYSNRTTVLQGGWPLFYIEWGWCWWNILILKTLWPLECSFWHYWHSFLRLSDSVFGIEKPPQNFGRVRGGISIIHLPIEVNPLWAVVFPLLYSQYSISSFAIQELLQKKNLCEIFKSKLHCPYALSRGLFSMS